MFTGIITDIGRVAAVERRGDTRFVVETSWDAAAIPVGASIACSGVCLTAVETTARAFVADASAETLSKTTLGAWAPGTPVNLERSLRVGDELGGHFVYGHVDGVATVVSVEPEGDSHRIVLEAPAALARYVAPKGSVAVDGVSLTVNEVDGARFGVNIIPHTWTATTLRDLRPGSRVNLEIDMLARYLQRLHEAR
jgi:riboflavin synthase